MNPDDRRLLLEWLEQEAAKPSPLADRLQQFGERRKDLEPLARFLLSKESEERVRRALADRERWHRSLSFRLISLLFGITGLALLGFVWWGEPQAFTAAVFFFGGCIVYYLAVQLLVSLRSRRATKAWQEAQRKFREELAALRADLGRK